MGTGGGGSGGRWRGRDSSFVKEVQTRLWGREMMQVEMRSNRKNHETNAKMEKKLYRITKGKENVIKME